MNVDPDLTPGDGSGSTRARTTKRYYDIAGTQVAVRDSAGSGSLTYLLGDQLGSTSVSVNAAGGTPVVQRYLPYGAPRSTTGGSAVTDKGWIGQTKDASTGLQYLNARYYDPTIGRFTAVDPLADQAQPATLDGYGYAGGSPVTMSDPTGLLLDCECSHESGSGHKSLARQIREMKEDQADNPQFLADVLMTLDECGSYGLGECGIYRTFSGKSMWWQAVHHEAAGLFQNALDTDLIRELEYGTYMPSWCEPVCTGGGGLAAIVATGGAPFVGGTAIRNVSLAGKTHPVTGVRFNERGFPQFPYKESHTSDTLLTGKLRVDLKTLGLSKAPAGYTWHHAEDGFTLQLVNRATHALTGHTGGRAISRGIITNMVYWMQNGNTKNR